MLGQGDRGKGPIMADKLGLGNGVHELKIGQSFFNSTAPGGKTGQNKNKSTHLSHLFCKNRDILAIIYVFNSKFLEMISLCLTLCWSSKTRCSASSPPFLPALKRLGLRLLFVVLLVVGKGTLATFFPISPSQPQM